MHFRVRLMPFIELFFEEIRQAVNSKVMLENKSLMEKLVMRIDGL